MPLRRYAGAGLARITLTQPGNQQRLAVFEARWFQVCNEGLVHFYGLHEFDTVEVSLRTDHFRCHTELVAKRAGECFVRAVSRLQRNRQDVGRAV